MYNLLLLALEFFKTGLFAVGGGLATIPFLQEMGVKYGWFTSEMLTTMIAVSESTPGPIGINMATYVGYHVGGIAGSLIATLSLVAPSIIVICLIAKMLDKYLNNKYVQGAFYGLRPSVVALIIIACLGIFEMTLIKITGTTTHVISLNYFSIVVLLVLFIVNHFKKIHPILVIVLCGLIGIIFKL